MLVVCAQKNGSRVMFLKKMDIELCMIRNFILLIKG